MMIFCRDFLKPPSPSQQDTNKLHFKSYAKTQQTIQEDINYYTIAVTFSLLFYPLPLTKPTNDKPMIIMPWEFFSNNKNLIYTPTGLGKDTFEIIRHYF